MHAQNAAVNFMLSALSVTRMRNDMDNKRCDDESLRELALFAGAGGGILGGNLLGWRTVCAVEWEEYQSCVLAQRQNDGILAPFPIWDDVQTFDGKPWRGIVDVISGGFPCQDISSAGKGAGIEGERSSMWKHMARIVGEVRPRFAFVENSPNLTFLGLNIVLSDLAKMGFDAEWGVVGANDVGAPHARKRIWILAGNTDENRRHEVAEIQESIGPKGDIWMPCEFDSILDDCPLWTDTERGRDLLGDGLDKWVGESESLGNGQVPLVAATAFRVLKQRLMTR